MDLTLISDFSEALPLRLPADYSDYTEESSQEDTMEADLKKALKDMAGAIGNLSHAVENAVPKAGESSGNADEKIARLEERTDWHRKVGWGIATAASAALLCLVNWWIPREIKAATSEVREGVKADTAAQLLPLQLELAKIEALTSLKQSKDVAAAFQNNADFSHPKAAIEVVKAIAEEAQAEKLPTTPAVLQVANQQVKNAVSSDSRLIAEAWSARLALLDYRSTLPFEPVKSNVPAPTSSLAGRLPLNSDGTFSNVRQKLDGVRWKNFTFENVEVEYDGGPVILEGVRFVNCTFVMKDTAHAEQLADLVLGEAAVTGDFA